MLHNILAWFQAFIFTFIKHLVGGLWVVLLVWFAVGNALIIVHTLMFLQGGN